MMQVNKPTYKATYLLFDAVVPRVRRILFFADIITATDLSKYGEVEKIFGDYYGLTVLGGYDFQEVIDYISQ